jgi:5-methylcytosine-specific restriction endonuclease McrA
MSLLRPLAIYWRNYDRALFEQCALQEIAMFRRQPADPQQRPSLLRRLIRWHMDTQDIPYHRERIPREVRHAVVRRDGTICRYCGLECGSGFDLDHVYPSSLGGKTTVGNLVVACRPCNRAKGARVGIWPRPVGYYRWYGRFGRWFVHRLRL